MFDLLSTLKSYAFSFWPRPLSLSLNKILTNKTQQYTKKVIHQNEIEFILDYKVGIKTVRQALVGMAQRTECRPLNQRSLVGFPVRVHAWVASQVPSRGSARGSHTLVFLSLSPALPLCLKINK